MARPSRRSRRTYSRTKRSKNKTLIGTTGTTTNGTQANLQLYQASYPCTMAGMRWNLDVLRTGTTTGDPCTGLWAIIIVRDGNTIPTLGSSVIMSPEQNVICWGSFILSTVNVHQHKQVFEDKTKSMRKLQGGDRIYFVMIATDVSAYILGTQFFTLV